VFKSLKRDVVCVTGRVGGGQKSLRLKLLGWKGREKEKKERERKKWAASKRE